MSKRNFRLWLLSSVLSIVGYRVVHLAADWQTPLWLSALVGLLGLISLCECLRWYARLHRERVSARCSARAAADYARRNYP